MYLYFDIWCFFLFNDTATTEIYTYLHTLSLHDALPIYFWMQTEGVFGVALGVSASMVFLFVLFGSVLDKAGAGNYFIQLSFALLGHLRGGQIGRAHV